MIMTMFMVTIMIIIPIASHLVLEIVLLVSTNCKEARQAGLVLSPLPLHNHEHHLGHVSLFFC